MSGWLLGTLHGGGVLRDVAVGIVTLFALVSLAALGLLAHHVVSAWRQALHARRMGVAVAIVEPAVGRRGALPPAVRRARDRVGDRATAAVLRQLKERVSGRSADEISEQLEAIGEVDRFARLSTARRSWLRRIAARGLVECGGDRSLAFLDRLLLDDDPEVRRIARVGLLGSHAPGAVQASLRSYRKDLQQSPGWRRSYYARLAAVAPEEVRRVLSDSGLGVPERVLALDASGEARDAEAARFGHAALASSEPELRAAGARLLGRLRDAGAVAPLTERLRDTEWYVRAAAARALERFASQPDVDAALVESLHDPAWWVRANAARALARRGEVSAAMLARMASSPDQYARDAALAQLVTSPHLAGAVSAVRAVAAERPNDADVAAVLAAAETASA